jgi:hypothetical protein
MEEDLVAMAARSQNIPFREAQAKIGTPINYGQIIKHFPDLPELGPYWRSHPICSIFGDLDKEDHLNGRPFRTALVFAIETSKPGQGIFETIENLRHQTYSQIRSGQSLDRGVERGHRLLQIERRCRALSSPRGALHKTS